MLKNKKIIGIIPARGGSKGIPRKNIKILAGKPLIAYTIEAALKSKYLDRVIVSTEDKEIAQISKKYGAEVIKRPKKLATDTARIIDVIFYLLKILKREEKYIPEIVILLQPTSPLRTSNDIDKAIDIFLKNKCESVISVCETTPFLYLAFKIAKNYLRPIFSKKYFTQRRQDLTKVYIPNGAIYISTPKNLLKYKGFYSKKTLPYIMPVSRSIDIDTREEFKIAEICLKNLNLDKKYFSYERKIFN
jgi:CMP-N,N'-diacetyllegionaminic acid synthase